MKRLLLVLLSLLLLPAPSRAQKPGLPPSAAPSVQPGGEVAARAAVEAWLTLVDAGQYDRSWDAAAGVVQKTVAKDQWVKMFADHRQPLGKVVSRTLKDSQSMTALPGTPPGQYVVVRYATSFEHKSSMAETITCGLGEGGLWKVTGYFVR